MHVAIEEVEGQCEEKRIEGEEEVLEDGIEHPKEVRDGPWLLKLEEVLNAPLQVGGPVGALDHTSTLLKLFLLRLLGRSGGRLVQTHLREAVFVKK